ncbi:hypothetical protein S40285_10567 [Stachybotrys chlorohalonatus IBT 40285]|uniref:Uncharacterized protein n=1 Tax=Stachybotrys chlorohalonatus (strain IBT 40285) TaxID=1283841 RepID=A0A084QFB6_STAC4|nr:hypothetical protein S40285_10567 [Stachybotrys chlorohalonata IBT 40285]
MARIIEFPILSPDHLPLPPGAFPSMFQQLRSIVEEPRAWAMFWPNDPLHQWILRMGELMPKKLDEHPLTFGLLEDAVSHITSFFGQDTLLAEWLLTVQGAVWMLTPVVTDTVVLGYGKVYRQLKEFIGYPDKEKEPRRVDNAMDHVVEEFMDDAQNRLGMDWNDDGYDGLVT